MQIRKETPAMKKIIIIALLMNAFVATATAQIDTLEIGQRVPNYYYWDTNWWDYYYLNYTTRNTRYGYSPWDSSIVYSDMDSSIHIGYIHYRNDQNRIEIARYCYTDTALTIIGVAGMIKKRYYEYPPLEDSSLNFPEYFRIYEVGDKGIDTMILLAEARWDTARISHYMPSEAYQKSKLYWNGETYIKGDTIWTSPFPIYEAYFDSAVVVNDSFYVAGTENNTVRLIEYVNGTYRSISNNPFIVHISSRAEGNGLEDINYYHPKPPIIKLKAHYYDTIQPNPWQYNLHTDYIFDTNWHTFANHKSFINLFPIFDTCPRCAPPDTCTVPQNLRATVSQYESGNATLMWDDNNNATLWELSICEEGCLPENGTITQHTTTFASIDNLDSTRWYTAWVRAICDSTDISSWSESIRFRTGSNTEGIESIVDHFTSIMPNPASSQVTVLSSFRLLTVELFSLNGQLITRKGVHNSITTTLPLGTTPKGTYLMRIKTSNGTTYKKLIVD